jgi:hypothetical protein
MLNLLDDSLEIERSDKRELARLCETIAIRWILAGSNAQVLENLFQKCSNELINQETEIDERVRNMKVFLQLEMPQDAKIKARFNEEIDSTNLVRVVLHRINESLTDNPAVLVQDPTKLNVEHIAPRTWTDGWMKIFYPESLNFEEKLPEYGALVEQWGNKSILEYKINSALKQELWERKRDGYRGVTGELIKGYVHSAAAINRDFSEVSAWDQSQIARRNRWIADCFVKIWAFETSDDIRHYSHFND